jgi:hypothetical protein
VIAPLQKTIVGMVNAGSIAVTRRTTALHTATFFGDAERSLKPRQLGVR